MTMNIPLHGTPRKRCTDELKRCWTQVVEDVKSIDDDIEQLIGSLREKHGYTREMASAELVRRLSFAAL